MLTRVCLGHQKSTLRLQEEILLSKRATYCFPIVKPRANHGLPIVSVRATTGFHCLSTGYSFQPIKFLRLHDVAKKTRHLIG